VALRKGAGHPILRSRLAPGQQLKSPTSGRSWRTRSERPRSNTRTGGSSGGLTRAWQPTSCLLAALQRRAVLMGRWALGAWSSRFRGQPLSGLGAGKDCLRWSHSGSLPPGRNLPISCPITACTTWPCKGSWQTRTAASVAR